YILLAANNKGLSWIHAFLSRHLMGKKEFQLGTRGRFFFADPEDGFVIYPFASKKVEELLANERIGVMPSELTKLFRVDMRTQGDKFVIRQPVTIQNKSYFALHRLLRCIDKNMLLSKLTEEMQCSPDETFLSPTELLDQFKAYPGIVTNTN